MPDYQALYTKLFLACDDAVNQIIRAQKECESACINGIEPNLVILQPIADNEDQDDSP